MGATSVTVDAKGIGTIDKDPNAVLDYPIRFGNWLAPSEAISSVTFPDTVGVTVDSSAIIDDAIVSPVVVVTVASVVRVWISGGTVGEDAHIVCRIVTDGGRTYDRTLKFKIREF